MNRKHRKTWYFIVRIGNGTYKQGLVIKTIDPARLEHLRKIAQEVNRKAYKTAKYAITN